MKYPSYIKKANLSDPLIRYEWDDWKWPQFCFYGNDSFYESYIEIEREAIIGFTIAEAEWLIYRYYKLTDIRLSLEYIEAAWCALIDRHYSSHIELRDKDWRGPIRKPIQIAVSLIDETLYLVEDWDNHLWQPAMLSALIEHVIVDTKPFVQWRDACLDRLLRTYREGNDSYHNLFEDQKKVIVPREVFNPEFDFKIEDCKSLIQEFLQSMDYKANRFLKDPKLMLLEGFKGTPYSIY